MENFRAEVKSLLEGELKELLRDVSYRIGVLQEHEKRAAGQKHNITSHMLTLATPQLDGYVIANNDPEAGKVSWTDCNIVFKGLSYVIVNGNTTHKYIWWDPASDVGLAFQTSNDKPTLGADMALVCINDGGTARIVLGQGKMTHGSAILTGTVDGLELKDLAVSEGKIGALAVTEGKLGAGAVTEAKIGALAVTEAKIGALAVTVGKIGAGAVAESKLSIALHLLF